MKPIIAISAGDTNGIGYEVIIKSLHDAHITEICTPIVYGNLSIARRYAKTLDEELHGLQWQTIDDVQKAREGHISIINCYPDDIPVAPGEATPEAGKAAFLSLQRAAADLQQGAVDALVTAPLNKETVNAALNGKTQFTGHTEYLAHLFGKDDASLMMLISEQMRVALVCNHTPITQLANEITETRIHQKIDMLDQALKDDFRIRNPRIAVLALNPHAGDNGLIGKEEQTIITPAIQKARESGKWVFGPYAADGFFGSGSYANYDAVLAMYHDQGLAPFKALDMNGVNYTAGLRIVRTSPDHGTAYDLAGKNQASPESMLHAIYMAIDSLVIRRESAELKQNPLPFIERFDAEGRPRPEFRTFGGPKKDRNTSELKIEN